MTLVLSSAMDLASKGTLQREMTGFLAVHAGYSLPKLTLF